MVASETDKVRLTFSESHPLCPWCEAPLTVIHWHKVRASPPLGYAAILSCARCHGVLEGLAHADQSVVIV
jgi:hypothetical protein